ncbi:MAG: PQQ-like beta-propeller repeat protein, partial [Candidatus Bathyarchaeota archaeon]|nr:PQQ-like beta-propeller repeat protein [Candidatus Bathyarchaeota archaeon]
MKKKVKFSCKTTATAVAFVLMLCMAASLVLLPARGQILWQGRTTAYPYIGAVPNPALVGEEVLLHIGITQELQQQPDGWEGLSVTIERPDGKTDTLEDIRTDSTGGTGRVYVPDIEGTYYLQTHFPAQWYNFSTFDFATFQMINVNYYYEDAVSEILELVVTAGEPTYWPGTPLPTEYWTRPIDSQLREWAPVAGSWLYNPGIFGTTVAPGNDDAPETAHVLWSKQLVLGGLAGGTLGDWATYTGDAYEGKFQGSLIIQGVFLYQKFDSVGTETTADVPVDNWVVAVDLHTGETLWEKELLDTDGNRLIPAFGQIYYWNSFNTHGTHAYLWAWEDPGFFGFAPTTWHAFDPLTGRWIYTMNNIPSGNRMYGPQGEILIYTINLAGGYMTCWNSSAVLDAYWGTSYPMWGSWRPQGKIIDATGPCPATSGTPYGLNGYQSNISIPTGLPGSVSRQFFDDVIFGYYRGDTVGMFSTISYDNPPFTIWAFDAQTGNLKFSRTHAAPSGNVSLTVATVSDEERVVVIWSKERRQLWGYSLENGNLLWGPTEPQHYLDIYAMYPTIEYGKLYSNGMSGIMYCYDAQTGDLLWNYTYRDMYGEV